MFHNIICHKTNVITARFVLHKWILRINLELFNDDIDMFAVCEICR